jgi:hypothetical protein
LSAAIVADWEKSNELTSGAERASLCNEPFLVAVFEQILCRRPTEMELRLCLDSMERQIELPDNSGQSRGAPSRRARESIVRALLNHNDFVTIR